MKEFGSDFHKCDSNYKGKSLFFDKIATSNLYSCGRHAIEAIIKHGKWNRIWMPAYFCYTVIGHINNLGIEVVFYDDNPLANNDESIVRKLPYKKGDVLFRTDYFGLRSVRSNKGINVPVIEDHTHGLITEWALKSDADWCVASLRKTLPIASGGILWSPKGLPLPIKTTTIDECEKMASIRYEAMSLKADYLINGGDKGAFREKYIYTEECIDNMEFSGIDYQSKLLSINFDIKKWTNIKINNWKIATKKLSSIIDILGYKSGDSFHPFSLVIISHSMNERDALRSYLIKNHVYPAILWQMPDDTTFIESKKISERMLSVHCDARYNSSDIEHICHIIRKFYTKTIN